MTIVEQVSREQRIEEYKTFISGFLETEVGALYAYILIQMILQDVSLKASIRKKWLTGLLVAGVDRPAIYIAENHAVPKILPQILAEYFYSLSDNVVPPQTDQLGENNEKSAVIKNAELEARNRITRMQKSFWRGLSVILGITLAVQTFGGTLGDFVEESFSSSSGQEEIIERQIGTQKGS